MPAWWGEFEGEGLWGRSDELLVCLDAVVVLRLWSQTFGKLAVWRANSILIHPLLQITTYYSIGRVRKSLSPDLCRCAADLQPVTAT